MKPAGAEGDRAATVEFGYTTWGMDVVRLAEPVTATVANKLLPRARSIARNGGVVLTIDGRLVRATVHRGSDASVTHIEFDPATAHLADTVRQLARTSPEPDERLHAALIGAGHNPAPTIANVDCSCPARTSMCVHVFATIYSLATRVDNSPQLALDIQDAGLSASHTPDEIGVTSWTPLHRIDVNTFYDLPPA